VRNLARWTPEMRQRVAEQAERHALSVSGG
jgi:hypothetical protein